MGRESTSAESTVAESYWRNDIHLTVYYGWLEELENGTLEIRLLAPGLNTEHPWSPTSRFLVWQP